MNINIIKGLMDMSTFTGVVTEIISRFIMVFSL
ncbi:hypothetical protein ABH961_000027 [Bacillus sp. RC251]